MAAGGIGVATAMAMSVLVYAGASMLAAMQLLAADAPMALLVFTALFVNLRFMMYSASLRQHLGGLPPRWKLLVSYFLADNAYAVCMGRYADHPRDEHKLAFYLGAALTVWLTWQAAVLAGALLGAGLPAAWRLEFAAPLAFIAMSWILMILPAWVSESEPPNTVKSLANTNTVRPFTVPQPVTTPSPGMF